MAHASLWPCEYWPLMSLARTRGTTLTDALYVHVVLGVVVLRSMQLLESPAL